MGHKLGAGSLKHLSGCTPEFQAVIQAAIVDAPVDFCFYCGHRPDEVQAELYAQGRTAPGEIVTWAKPGESRHGKKPSDAGDLAPYINGRIAWDAPAEVWARLAGHICGVASVMGYPLEWGGDWVGKEDKPHFQARRV